MLYFTIENLLFRFIFSSFCVFWLYWLLKQQCYSVYVELVLK